MVEMARKKNSAPLPMVPDTHGCVILPKEQDCLTSVNYQVEPRKSLSDSNQTPNQ